MIGYGEENPAYADACIYGNRFPICNRRRHYEEEEDELPPDLYDVTIEIDTHELDEEETNDLAESIEDVSGNFNLVSGEAIDEEGACFEKIIVNGFSLLEEEYDAVIDVIKRFNVNFSEKVEDSKW